MLEKKIKEKKFEATPPQYTSPGIAVWCNTSKEGIEYLNIQIIGHSTIKAFKNNPKTKE